jgi:hypothetical protein
MATGYTNWAWRYDPNAWSLATVKVPDNNPCVSLSILYPRWVSDMETFACPSTSDRPIIIKETLKRMYHGCPDVDYEWAYPYQGPKEGSEKQEYSWFAKMNGELFKQGAYPQMFLGDRYEDMFEGELWEQDNTTEVPAELAQELGLPAGIQYCQEARRHDESVVSENNEWDDVTPCRSADQVAITSQNNTSYFYDDLGNFRDMAPGSARMCDAVWYDQADNIRSNHGGDGPGATRRELEGFNVLHFDGSVAFSPGNDPFASNNRDDNIFTDQTEHGTKKQVPADADALLFRTHYDPLDIPLDEGGGYYRPAAPPDWGWYESGSVRGGEYLKRSRTYLPKPEPGIEDEMYPWP